MMIQRNNILYLYIHVPFCKSICSYCDFTHRPYQENIVDEWLNALQKELQYKNINPCLKTIYIGGGTPSCLNHKQLEQLFILLQPYSESIQEYTIELNPETIDEDKVILLEKYHINRVSIGFQTSNTTLLKLMNRHHTLSDMQRVISLLHKHNITNISLDLMYSLPGQTMEMLKQSIDDALSLKPTHLSLYSLTIEENTVFAKKGYDHLDDEIEAQMYEYICEVLEKNHYHQYEISNFCLDGYESIHNQAYWKYDDFYGIGCGASGKENHIRYDNTKDLKTYLNDPLATDEIPLDQKDEMFEMVMMSLRLKKGLDMNRFKQCFHESFMVVYASAIQSTMEKGWTTIEGDAFLCTPLGYEIMNTVLLEFLE